MPGIVISDPPDDEIAASTNSAHKSGWLIDFGSSFDELFALLIHPALEGFFLGDGLLSGVFPHVFGDLHGAEVGGLRAFLREGFIVELTGRDGIE